MKKRKFTPPVINCTTELELEGAILGPSKEYSPEAKIMGHETNVYTTDSYWENVNN